MPVAANPEHETAESIVRAMVEARTMAAFDFGAQKLDESLKLTCD